MPRVRRTAVALARGLGLGAIGVVHVLVAVVVVVCLLLSATAVFAVLLLPALRLVRRWTGLARRLARDWSGVEIAVPYLPEPPPATPQPDGWYRDGRSLYRTPRMPNFNRRMNWVLKDPATWRDLAWVVTYAFGGPLLPLAPALMIGYGGVLAFGLVSLPWLAAPVGAVAGVALAAAGLYAAPWTLRLHGLWLRGLLGPTEKALLARRMRSIAESRTETADSQAAQLRRIERDLHDGAQARLVAVGMTLGAAEQLLTTDPAAAEALIAKAREASAATLAELRRLVRGIQPPVLAERGLVAALDALAIDSPMEVTLRADTSIRCQPSAESAIYFAVSELLTNAVRHGGAAHATVELRLGGEPDGTLTVVVTDDGRGGADPERGSGLRGIGRRLASFDGSLTLDSPEGGPTVATLRIPVGPPVAHRDPPRRAGPPAWRRWAAGVCFASFALPLFPLGVVSIAFALAGVPEIVWVRWLGMTGMEWPLMIAMVLLGTALLTMGIVLSVQNVREARGSTASPSTLKAEVAE
ncbi:histidine kinase [Spongiactinospora sp. TRM90649]|uniref:sensor histidine kinase n=1 Tax=Spongiactinospora sp. TRM90649 TaxID=3031114 RepID=UPI0023F73063|nr:histidine kinase [Spongiactinospora sp. TRM90649]MDF5756099.1 histidine kinase [Spongiactinospora sp. TRM90649]